ncbi:MAG: hypothetical protein ACUVV4_08630 [Candidatus Bathyarchaeia archaeon]
MGSLGGVFDEGMEAYLYKHRRGDGDYLGDGLDESEADQPLLEDG